ncbi:SNF2 helicase associated domain-containing protein [Cohnella sp. JJ-181]|uniref:DEAD/DEAH box helicase n=1 Tax=Cohnella rhizoplanae TaxID=2974897 RepID=UPI0022FFB6C3|nr:SNF2 helicase associated domain-containing protein [Cohnella sp. JJ-181]CAI6040211.1 RNA polymerase-associated protein RapA [Cohnella sp. JJ-181]
MSGPFTRHTVRSLCGRIAYESGMAYARAGKVTFAGFDDEAGAYQAFVQGGAKAPYEATIQITAAGDIAASCTCPSLASYGKYCNHIAAALLRIIEFRLTDGAPGIPSASGGVPISAGQDGSGDGLAARMIGLFQDKPALRSGARRRFETREQLSVGFLCAPLDEGRAYALGIEARVGTKSGRAYPVRQIGRWLDSVERGESHMLAKAFTYDPELHCFSEADDEILRALIRVNRGDHVRVRSPSGLGASGARNERTLAIPPEEWEALASLLRRAEDVSLQAGERLLDGLPAAAGPLPVRYEVDDDPEGADGGCQLEVRGLEAVTVLEAYGLVLTEEGLVPVPRTACAQLAQLQHLLPAGAVPRRVRIPREQTDDFMERVVPGLMRIGSVRIAEAVTDKIVREPLAAKLYLDRVRDRLLAGLEFHYGPIMLNPLEAAASKRADGGPILVRDGERERRILELMDDSAFVRTEAGYVMGGDEEGEFEFLYRVLPLLEPLLSVYATSAVRIRLLPEPVAVKVSADTDERTDWLEFKFDISGIPEAEIKSLLQALQEKRTYYRVAGGAFVPLGGQDFAEVNRLLAATGMLPSELKDGKLRMPLVRGLHLLEGDGGAVKQGRELRRLLDNLRHPDQSEFDVPEALSGTLRDYQLYGYRWMRMLAHYSFGGILADDMGLGKTVQSIAFVASMLPVIRERGHPALIVCPASLMYNWLSELRKFAPDIRARIVDGVRSERAEALAEPARYDAVIVSYPLLRKDVQLYATMDFHTLILDEAQAVKNETTQTAQAVKRIAAEHRFALTGTPIENALDELRSIAGAVFPGLFPGRRAFSELSREEVADRIRPFVLRRLKSDVLRELPEKIETVIASELLPAQKKLYTAYLAKLRTETLKHLDRDTFHRNRIQILAGITRLRQLCCHPALFVEDYAGGSAKLDQLLELLEDCRSAGRRALVFSQFTSMLAMIRRELGARGMSHFYLDGDTPASERVALCDRFNAGERELFLASLKAGGTGLNLTGADTVILYDLWWNPAVEQQAADRVHRIGQQRAVQVIRLVAQGTVEDKMAELQQRKRHLIDEVIRPGQEALSALGEQDIRELLAIGQE